jgi:hypothetical protein
MSSWFVKFWFECIGWVTGTFWIQWIGYYAMGFIPD